MSVLLHHLIRHQQRLRPNHIALLHGHERWTYHELYQLVRQVAAGLANVGIHKGQRVAIYLPKHLETVVSFFAASACGAVFVPINPLLKPAQIAHIINDCDTKLLITSGERWQQLSAALSDCESLSHTVLTSPQKPGDIPTLGRIKIMSWQELLNTAETTLLEHGLDSDLAAILYTSGSTGQPKGVVLSHRNMLAGADSVATYLGNTSEDRLLAVLPFSFDYGLSQLTTAFHVGASVALMDYLLPRDVIKALSRYEVTGLAAVPPLWNQLAELDWPEDVRQRLRYITNSGGAMPQATTEKLQRNLPQTDIFLMYGLTEAFRSTYLPPDQVAVRPTSMGKAIPNAEILVVRDDGSLCDANEVGELVHRGPLVAQGYWNDPAKTAERFKPAPRQLEQLPLTEIAVWSGDQVYRDAEGFLYFVSRKDEMIKTSGYRVSPTEVEEVLFHCPMIREAVALGISHPTLGQAIVLVVCAKEASTTADEAAADKQIILQYCRQQLPNFMIPHEVIFNASLPRNPNGKIDRKLLAQELSTLFEEPRSE